MRSRAGLSEADGVAIDALFGGGSGGGEADRERVGRVEGLLSLLELGEPLAETSDRRLLVDVTFARVLRARDEHAVAARLGAEPAGPALGDADKRAIDEMVEGSWRAGSERSRRAHGLLSLIDSTLEPGGERERLVEASLRRVQDEMDSEARRLRLRPVERPAGVRPSLRWRDIAAVAAMLLIACGIFWPMANGVRLETRRAAGAAHLQQAALGFGMFAADHDDRLPARDDHGVEGLWWQVGTPEKSHSANLYTLVRRNYVPIEALASPGNPHAATEAEPGAQDWASAREVSYSYQLFGEVVPALTTYRGSARVVLADRSPIVERARQGLRVDPRVNSSNQAGLGQLVLFTDGRVRFLRSPELEDGDNLWLPRGLEGSGRPSVVGTELPSSGDDAFVGP